MSNTQESDLINQSNDDLYQETIKSTSTNQVFVSSTMNPSITMDSPSSPDSHILEQARINEADGQTFHHTTMTHQAINQSKPMNNEKSLLLSPIPLVLRLPETVNSSLDHLPVQSNDEQSPVNQPMSVTVSPIPNQSTNQTMSRGLFPPSPHYSFAPSSPVLGSTMSYWNTSSGNHSNNHNQSINQPNSPFPATPSFDSIVASAALAATAFAQHPAIQSINQSLDPSFKQEHDNNQSNQSIGQSNNHSSNHLSDRYGLPHLDLGVRASSTDQQARYQYQSSHQPMPQYASVPFGTLLFSTPAFAPMTQSVSQSMINESLHPSTNQNIGQSVNQWSPLTPLLSTIHALFDGARRLSPQEEQAWRSLMEQSINQSNNQFARAQAEIAELRQTFDGFLAKIAQVFYSHQSNNQSSDATDHDELRSHVESMAAKFCTLRGAILNSALTQASITDSINQSVGQASDVLPAFEVEEHSTKPKKKRGSKSRRNYFDKRSTRILKEWLSQHLDDPYPNAAVKTELAERCGLTYDQIGHWFINSRMRIWRPMLRRGQVPTVQPVQAIPIQENGFPQTQ